MTLFGPIIEPINFPTPSRYATWYATDKGFHLNQLKIKCIGVKRPPHNQLFYLHLFRTRHSLLISYIFYIYEIAELAKPIFKIYLIWDSNLLPTRQRVGKNLQMKQKLSKASKSICYRGDLKYGENIWTLWSSMPTKPNPKSPVQVRLNKYWSEDIWYICSVHRLAERHICMEGKNI